jgi:hypothetical protein
MAHINIQKQYFKINEYTHKLTCTLSRKNYVENIDIKVLT